MSCKLESDEFELPYKLVLLCDVMLGGFDLNSDTSQHLYAHWDLL